MMADPAWQTRGTAANWFQVPRVLAYDLLLILRYLVIEIKGPITIFASLVIITAVLYLFYTLFARLLAFHLPNLAVLTAMLWGGIGYKVEGAVARRLHFLASESVIAADALDRRGIIIYRVFWHLVAIFGLSPLVWLIGRLTSMVPASVALTTLCYLIGSMLIDLRFKPARHGSIRLRAHHFSTGSPVRAHLLLVAAYQLHRPQNLVAVWLATILAGLTLPYIIGVALSQWREEILIGAVIVPFLAVLPSVTRYDYTMAGLVAHFGLSAGAMALAYLAVPIGFLGAGLLGLLLAPIPQKVLVISAVIGGGTLLCWNGLCRCWRYPGRSKPSVDLRTHIDAAILLVLGYQSPLAGGVYGVWCLWSAHRHYSRMQWRYN